MSDGMAFLTGAAFAGVAVLFVLRGGPNLGATNLPSSQPLPITPTNLNNPYNNPYGMGSPSPTPASPGSALYDQQRFDSERTRLLFEQQRAEIEQLKAQLQNQQQLIGKLSTQPNADNQATWSKPPQAVTPQQQQENPMLSGLVWALGGMAITVSGGVIVVGALSILSRQQRPPRTTYVVQQPYNALPHTLQPRRRTEVIPPHVEERRVDYVEYDR